MLSQLLPVSRQKKNKKPTWVKDRVQETCKDFDVAIQQAVEAIKKGEVKLPICKEK